MAFNFDKMNQLSQAIGGKIADIIEADADKNCGQELCISLLSITAIAIANQLNPDLQGESLAEAASDAGADLRRAIMENYVLNRAEKVKK